MAGDRYTDFPLRRLILEIITLKPSGELLLRDGILKTGNALNALATALSDSTDPIGR
jgi:hypothetical protein